VPFFDNRVTVADPAGFDLDADLSARGLRDWTLHNFEVSAGTRDLDGFHGARHIPSCDELWMIDE
jgi:hypothetical protein